VLSEDFCAKNSVIKIMHIYTDNQGTFWSVFAFYFTSCYNSTIYYHNLECRNKTVWMFNRDQNFRGNSFTRNDCRRFLIVWYDFPDSKVLTLILWRHNHRKFSDGSKNNCMQATAEPQPTFDAPLFLTHSSRLYCHEWAGWGRQNWVCSRPRETLGTPLHTQFSVT